MANYPVLNTMVKTIPLQLENAYDTVVPMNFQDIFSVVSNNPTSLQATIGADQLGNPELVLTPMVQEAMGIVVTVSDLLKLADEILVVDIVASLTVPAKIGLNFAAATDTPKNEPAPPVQ